MSSTLLWKPKERAQGQLDNQLKRAISKRLWDTDGSCGTGEASICHDDIGYLEGLRDGGIEGAQELIDLIEEHGKIILWHEFL